MCWPADTFQYLTLRTFASLLRLYFSPFFSNGARPRERENMRALFNNRHLGACVDFRGAACVIIRSRVQYDTPGRDRTFDRRTGRPPKEQTPRNTPGKKDRR